MTVHIITLTSEESQVEVFKDIFAVLTINQKAADNGLWIKLVHNDPTIKDTWIEYDPDKDTLAVLE